ncbi:hypothetical protein RSSM_02089, partial [Rhodopirellula sallentina SM41]
KMQPIRKRDLSKKFSKGQYNGRDQRAAANNMELTENRDSAAPLHPMVMFLMFCT